MKAIPVNNSPDLSMTQITKKLFNNQFLSDIQFITGGQTIYAHSLELMKRSSVFEKKLESTWCNKKFIHINSVQYESLYQFIRFLYTDKCHIDDKNGFELLKLAKTYKVIKLENQLIDYLYCGDTTLLINLFDFCIKENYTLMLDRVTIEISANLKGVLASPNFETIQPMALEAILQLKYVHSKVKEIQIFDALLRWIHRHCADNNLILSKHKQKFQKYIKLIRFSAITDKDILDRVVENTDLFMDSEYALFYKKLIPKASKDMVNSNKRKGFRNRLEKIPFIGTPHFSTKFTVSTKLLLTSLIFGTTQTKTSYEIKIFSSNKVENGLKFNIALRNNWKTCCLNLGEFIELEPNVEYTIRIKLSSVDAEYIYCPEFEKIILSGNGSKNVMILEPGENMIEMFFKTM